jgi:CTP-dependent riboflavin kinase
MATRLQARVTTGLGKAKSNVGTSAASVAAALGLAEVYPGTLNLALGQPFEVPVDAHPVVLPSLGARHQPFYFYPAELAGKAVWVTRSLSQIEVADDLLEIVADCSLRAALNLQDGDEVVLTLRTAP